MSSPPFESLSDLHDSVNNLLRSPDINGLLFHHKQDRMWIQKVSESSLKMLDSCANTKEVLSLVKCHIQQLRSSFHRASLGETENKLSTYCFQRKELRKQMFKRLKSLKRMKNTTNSGHDTPIMDDSLVVVANVLKEVRGTIVVLLESTMLLMSMPNPIETTKMTMKCNGALVVKAKFTRLNSLGPWEDCDVQALHGGIERLEAVESAMEDLEVELGSIFKRLMRTRVLLLNILTN